MDWVISNGLTQLQGDLRIEAPPEAAGTLAAMFQGMADLLSSAVGPP